MWRCCFSWDVWSRQLVSVCRAWSDGNSTPAPTSNGASTGLPLLTQIFLTQNTWGPEFGGVNSFWSLEHNTTVIMYTCRLILPQQYVWHFIPDSWVSGYTHYFVKGHCVADTWDSDETWTPVLWWAQPWISHSWGDWLCLAFWMCPAKYRAPNTSSETLGVLKGQHPCQALQDWVFLKFQPLCWVPSNLWVSSSYSLW